MEKHFPASVQAPGSGSSFIEVFRVEEHALNLLISPDPILSSLKIFLVSKCFFFNRSHQAGKKKHMRVMTVDLWLTY